LSAADKRPWQFAVVIFTANCMTEAFIKALPGVDACPKRAAAKKVNYVIGAVHRGMRFATRNDHASIDRMLLAFDLSAAEDYRAFLTVHVDALLTLKDKWRAVDSADFGRMLDCLKSDLKSLGVEVPPGTAPSGNAVDRDQALGIAYVIRGSRLGAAVLRHHVGCTMATSYLDFVPAISWKEFLVQLESIAEDRSRIEVACRAARAAFGAFTIQFIRANRMIAKPPA